MGKIYWLDQSGQKVEAKKNIEKLIDSGWLPDYSDNIFSEKDMLEIYLSSNGSISDWVKRLGVSPFIEQILFP